MPTAQGGTGGGFVDYVLWGDSDYPPRRIDGFYNKSELELMIQRRSTRQPLESTTINRDIASRYYQERAIRRIGETFEKDHQRRALLIMATGSGKTRTVVGLTDLLMRCNWAKRVLFLADRVALVNQAGNAFKAHLPNVSLVNLVRDHDGDGRVFVSTYPTMMGLIDATKDGQRRLGPGYFARVITHSVDRAQDLIDDFYVSDRDPRIAISVDMLDTGINVPQVANLVFFKIVRSKTKFWQMLGRGTRLSPELFGPGQDKEYFFVFDYCSNLSYFSINPDATDGSLTPSLSSLLFSTRVELLGALDDHLAGDGEETASQVRSSIAETDLSELERMLEESGIGGPRYVQEAAQDSHGLGLFVRSLIGLERSAAKEALTDFMWGKQFTSEQIDFVNMIVDHLCETGII